MVPNDRQSRKSFDIRQIRYAVAAADHGSFYRAARALDVEQSTLSRTISKLEQIVGAPIFERSRVGVKTTFSGAAFLSRARPLIASADKLIDMMCAVGRGHAGKFVIGHNSAVSAGNLHAIYLDWMHMHRDIEVERVEADRSALLAGVDVGEIDFVILMGAMTYNGFRCEPLWSERLLVALPVGHLLASREVVHWTDLRDEVFHQSAADPGPEIRDLLLGRLAVAGVKPEIKLHQCSRETILSLLGGGASVSIVCEGSTGTAYPDVVYRSIRGEQGPALIGYSGYWRNDNANPVLRRFLEFIKSRFALNFNLARKSVE